MSELFPFPTTQPVRLALAGMIVAAIAVLVFGARLEDEPSFVDEWAYVSQAFYVRLFLEPDDRLWLDHAAIDLPPLAKYVVGGALLGSGHRLPPPIAARRWYESTNRTFGSRSMLTAARRPMVVFGALGCVAVYALGVMAADVWVGLAAAGLLMLDPLYRMLSRRAMSDVPAEALILVTAAVGLWGWRALHDGHAASGRRLGALVAFALAGAGAGLAALAKFNGVLGLLILTAWTGLGVLCSPGRFRRLDAVLGLALAWLTGALTFLLLNPTLTARPEGSLPGPVAAVARMGPWERAVLLLRHRLAVPRDQQMMFPHNALQTPAEKIAAVAVQGFGRFGALGAKRFDPVRGWWFDSTRRYDWAQDRGAVVWLPWTAAGAVWAFRLGRAQRRAGEPPSAWAVLLQAATALVVVTTFLPLAWDRFFLSIQAGSCLLAAGVLVAAVRGAGGLIRRCGAEGGRKSAGTVAS